MAAFFFDANKGETPESLERRRAVAEAMFARALGRTPQNVGEGIDAMGKALAGVIIQNRADAAETTGRASADAAFGDALAGFNFGSPAASPAVASSAPSPASGGVPSFAAAQPSGDAGKSFSAYAPQVISQLSKDFDISPQQAAGVVGQLGHESRGLQAINEDKPLVPGSRGGFGWAQWTGPRRRAFEAYAKANGMSVGSPEANYAFLKHELQGPEGRVLNSVRAAPDAYSAGRAFTDGFLRPGIPGYESRDNWTARALAFAGQPQAAPMPAALKDEALLMRPVDRGEFRNLTPEQARGFANAAPDNPAALAQIDPATAAQPIGRPAAVGGIPINEPSPAQVQSASFQPGDVAAAQGVDTLDEITVPTSPVPIPPARPPLPMQAPQGGMQPDPRARVMAAMGGAPAAPQPAPNGAAIMAGMEPHVSAPMAPPSLAAAPPAMRVAQAMQGGAPAAGAGSASRPAGGGSNIQRILGLASNRWLSPAQRSVVEMLLKNELARNAPISAQDQLAMEKMRVEIENLRNPKQDPFTLSDGQARYDPQGRLIAKGPAKAAEGFTLGEGQKRFDATGREIAVGAPKTPDDPPAVREYLFAKQQGFPGTFADWEASKKGGMSLQVDPATGAVTFQQGGNIKPLTESQSKDTVYATRAEGALRRLEETGDALTNFGETVYGQAPVVGNYLKSERFQKAEQAGREFLQAVLRKDTGAAITSEETTQYGGVYLPRPGDSPGVLEQKKQSRARALEAIKAGMPAQAILAQERALLQSTPPTPAAPQSGFQEGQRARNPKTGQTLIFRNGQWAPE